MTVTWDAAVTPANVTLSNGNLTCTGSSGGAYRIQIANTAITGKKYWELQVTWGLGGGTNEGVIPGVANASESTSGNYVGQTANSGGFHDDGQLRYNGVIGTDAAGFSNGGTPPKWVGLAYDADAKLLWLYTGTAGSWTGRVSIADDPATGTGGIDCSAGIGSTVYPAVSMFDTNDAWTANFGASTFQFTPPSGFTALDSGSGGAVLFAQSVL